MKVRTNSWHYKVYKFGYGVASWPPRTTNLCRYFWRVVWGLLTGAALVLIATLFVSFIGVMLYDHTFATLAVLAGIAALIAAAVINDRRPYKEKVEVEPGLVRSYLKAKKSKVCPLIEIVG